MSFVEELKRRNVFRVAIAYLALAWLLIEIADTLFPVFDAPEWSLRLLVILLAMGFLPSLVFSWAYEITPQGLKREKQVDRSESIVHITAKRLDWVTIILVSFALAIVAIDRLWLDALSPADLTTTHETSSASADATGTHPVYPSNTIAVLPFANRSARPEDVYFVEGIHHDLLNKIAQIDSITSISRTSVMQYKDATTSVRDIARELRVATILEGSVQRAGDKVRINVELIDASSDEYFWSRSYDRQLTAANIFAIQSEIAGEVAAALRTTLSPETRERINRVPTESLPALEAYFIGSQAMATRTIDDLAKAAENLELAVELDPDFALAWTSLADTYLLQASYSDLPWDEMMEKSRMASARALQLDPYSGEAHASLAKLKSWTGDRKGAEHAFRKAIELNPNYAPAYQWYGEMLGMDSGRTSEALALSRRAIELDPKSAIIANDYAEVLERAGRFVKARAQYTRATTIEPRFAHGFANLAVLESRAFGRLDNAVTAFRKSLDLEPDNWRTIDFLGRTYLSLGDPELAAAMADRTRQLAPEDEMPWLPLALHLYNGAAEQALPYARELLALKPGDRMALGVLANHELREGRGEEMLDRYRQLFPGLLKKEPDIDWRNHPIAFDIARTLLEIGEHDHANQLLDQILNSIRSIPRLGYFGYGVLDARVHALRGEEAKALLSLNEAVNRGWRWNSWYYLDQDPVLQQLRDDPEFQSLRASIRDDMAEQLGRVSGGNL